MYMYMHVTNYVQFCWKEVLHQHLTTTYKGHKVQLWLPMPFVTSFGIYTYMVAEHSYGLPTLVHTLIRCTIL